MTYATYCIPAVGDRVVAEVRADGQELRLQGQDIWLPAEMFVLIDRQ